MYTHIVVALPGEIVAEIENLEHLPVEKQFDVLKKAILQRHKKIGQCQVNRTSFQWERERLLNVCDSWKVF